MNGEVSLDTFFEREVGTELKCGKKAVSVLLRCGPQRFECGRTERVVVVSGHLLVNERTIQGLESGCAYDQCSVWLDAGQTYELSSPDGPTFYFSEYL